MKKRTHQEVEIGVESDLKSEKKTTNRTVEDEPGVSEGVKKHLQ